MMEAEIAVLKAELSLLRSTSSDMHGDELVKLQVGLTDGRGDIRSGDHSLLEYSRQMFAQQAQRSCF
jgi:hypothetical protein